MKMLMKNNTMGNRIVFCLSAIMFFSAGCRENLPVRVDLSDQVRVTVRSRYETKSKSSQAGQIRIFLTVTNRTDETLDDVAPISGQLEVTWQVPKDYAPRFSITRTLPFTFRNIFSAKKFNEQTQRLTIDPKDSLVISMVWDLKSNDSTYLLPYFPWTEDMSGCYVAMPFESVPVRRRISVPQAFIVKANVKIFDRLAVLTARPTTIRQCIMHPHNGEFSLPPFQPCSDLTFFDPCDVIGH